MRGLRIFFLVCCWFPLFSRSLPASDELVELVTGLLGEQDKEMRALGFDQIRKEAKGEAATKKFADLLAKFPAETQVGLLSALADRGDAAAAPAVRKLLSAADEGVQIAAIKAIGPLGNSDDLPALLELIGDPSESKRDAARASLIRLPPEVSAAMINELKMTSASKSVALCEILTTRRSREAIPALLTAASHSDLKVRQAAIASLADLGEEEQIPQFLPLITKSPAGRERETIEKAVAAICLRNPAKNERANHFLAALKQTTAAEQTLLLATLGRIGSKTALDFLDPLCRSSEKDQRSAAIRALCNWPDGQVVSRLLTIARTETDADLRKAAFQALVRIAPLADERDDQRRLDTLRTVFAMCTSDAERNQVLDRAKAIRHIATLRFIIPFMKQPTFAEQACLTVVELAHHSSLREANKEEFLQVLNQVQAISTNATVKDRAERYKTGQTWVRPKEADGS